MVQPHQAQRAEQGIQEHRAAPVSASRAVALAAVLLVWSTSSGSVSVFETLSVNPKIPELVENHGMVILS